jgi:hypothetical protein
VHVSFAGFTRFHYYVVLRFKSEWCADLPPPPSVHVMSRACFFCRIHSVSLLRCTTFQIRMVCRRSPSPPPPPPLDPSRAKPMQGEDGGGGASLRRGLGMATAVDLERTPRAWPWRRPRREVPSSAVGYLPRRCKGIRSLGASSRRLPNGGLLGL